MADTQPVSAVHKELYHYTTALGLEGIVRSQKLWATHMGYLNDPEEHEGFFVRRLPKLLEKPSREAVAELMKGPKASVVMEEGGPDRAAAEFQSVMSELIHRVTKNINEPYLVSFCSGTAHTTASDGLLSQWRGYGTDGGYALVFDTAKLEELLLNYEAPAYQYQFANFSDVDYDFPEGSGPPPHPERTNWEEDVQAILKRFILNPAPNTGDLHVPISGLASRYKHHGFSEEREVRIVAIPAHDEVHALSVEEAKRQGKTLPPRKPLKFRVRAGVLVPYLELFGGSRSGPTRKLPITRVLVGPHADREKRAASVRALLKQCEMDVPVLVSGIPYLGL